MNAMAAVLPQSYDACHEGTAPHHANCAAPFMSSAPLQALRNTAVQRIDIVDTAFIRLKNLSARRPRHRAVRSRMSTCASTWTVPAQLGVEFGLVRVIGSRTARSLRSNATGCCRTPVSLHPANNRSIVLTALTLSPSATPFTSATDLTILGSWCPAPGLLKSGMALAS